MINNNANFTTTTPDADYPSGGAVDESAPAALDGTPLLAIWVNDFFGLAQAVLDRNSVVPSNTAETAVISQIFRGMASSFTPRDHRYAGSGPVNAYVLTSRAGIEKILPFKDGQEVTWLVNITNNSTVTVATDGDSPVALVDSSGTALGGGELVAGTVVKMIFNLASVNFRLAGIEALPPGDLFKLTIEPDVGSPTTDVKFNIGKCRDRLDVLSINFPTAFVKELTSTWVAGTGNGGLATGVVGNNTTYHCLVLSNVAGDTGAGFDTDPTGVNLLANANVIAAGLTHVRRVGAFRTDGGGLIRGWTQQGDTFTPDVKVSNWTETATTTVQNQLLDVPLGIKVKAGISVRYTQTSTTAVRTLYYDPDAPVQAAGVASSQIESDATGASLNGKVNFEVVTDVNASVDYVSSIVAGGTTNDGSILYWIDDRGRTGLD